MRIKPTTVFAIVHLGAAVIWTPMVRQLLGAVSAVVILGVGVALAGPTPCSANITCRCFVEAGATYDAFSKKLRLEENQWIFFDRCLSRGLQTTSTQPKSRPRKFN
jgi:hypothetical protein